MTFHMPLTPTFLESDGRMVTVFDLQPDDREFECLLQETVTRQPFAKLLRWPKGFETDNNLDIKFNIV